MNGGNVIFHFKGDTKDAEEKTKGFSKTLQSVASTGGKALLGLAEASATALIDITRRTIKARGEVEQQIGGTEAVFGELASVVQDKATKAFDQMGISANDYMAYANKIASLMKGSGIETQQALDLTSKAMQRASDVASVMGISTESAMEAITGASKGNFTMMDNLGVAMNATSLNAYALEKGMKKTYQQMSQGEKVQLAYQMFLEKSSYATGNYAKENKTFAGSLNTLKASFQNLVGGTGNVSQFMGALSNFVNVLVGQLPTLIPQIVDGIVQLINGILPMIPNIIKQVLPSLIQGVVALTIGLIEVLPDIIQMIADIIPDLIPQIVDAIMLIIPALVENTPALIKAGMQLTAGLIKGVILGTAQLLKNIADLGAKAIAKIKEKFAGKSPLEIGKMLVQGLWNGINNAKQWVLDKIKGFGKSILNGIKKIFGISSPSKEFEIIGRYNVMGLEKGMDEEKLKLQDSFNSMFDLSPNLYGSSSLNLSPKVQVINNINMKQDSLGQMVNDIKTFSGGAKNDYSYGMGA